MCEYIDINKAIDKYAKNYSDSYDISIGDTVIARRTEMTGYFGCVLDIYMDYGDYIAKVEWYNMTNDITEIRLDDLDCTNSKGSLFR